MIQTQWNLLEKTQPTWGLGRVQTLTRVFMFSFSNRLCPELHWHFCAGTPSGAQRCLGVWITTRTGINTVKDLLNIERMVIYTGLDVGMQHVTPVFCHLSLYGFPMEIFFKHCITFTSQALHTHVVTLHKRSYVHFRLTIFVDVHAVFH